MKFGEATTEKLIKLRKEKAKNQEITRPAIPLRKISPNFPQRLLNYKKFYEKKKEMQKIEFLEFEEAKIRDPEICEKSRKIVEALKIREKVEERLQDKDNEYKQKREAFMTNKKTEYKMNAMPSISPLARKIVRNGDIVTRLTAYKHKYDEHLQELQIKYWKTPIKKCTRSNSASKERLLRPKSEYFPSHPFSFTPSLGQKTRNLAKNMGRSYERLLNSQSPYRASIEDPECYFVPEINPISALIAKRENVDSNVWESLYSLRESQTCRNKDEDLNEENLYECTFHPTINGKNKNASPEKFLNRVINWNKDRKEKLVKEKGVKLRDDLKECTFSPDIKRLDLENDEVRIYENKECLGYSKKYKVMEAQNFLTALERMQKVIHNQESYEFC